LADVVPNSQFATIERTEITEIRKAYIEAGGDAERLTLAFIVVGKRHHTRFYAATKQQTYQSNDKRYDDAQRRMITTRIFNGNLKPGLLVDDVVTASKPFNFFLQSHAAIKGTARSAHYYVLENDTDIDRAGLQSITMMLCYTFGRSMTGNSYAAPAYIAGRLCERGRAYIRTWAEDRFAEPVFEYTEYKDSHGKVRKPTDEERLEEKRGMVSAILDFEMTKSKDAPVSERKIWGNYKAGARLNPWHSNLDQGMFWI
jgi:eukaryotic translation initiation factor 2C